MITIEQVARWVRRNSFLRSQFVQAGGNDRQAGLPILLNDSGVLDASMINDGDIDHTAITNIGSNTHAQIDTHIAATAAHGATGAVVGTTNTQTLTNKTLTTPTIGSFANAAHNHTDAAGGGQLTVASMSDQGSWAAPSYNTGWADLGGGYAPVRYRRFGNLVMLRGAAVRNSGTETTIFTLPSGFRPPVRLEFAVVGSGEFARVDVLQTGTVLLIGSNPDTGVWMDGIAFSAV